jgi:hypothetical protein
VKNLVALNINDLQHILAQIKLAEEHMRLIGTGMDPREALASLVPNGLTPWGLRTTDGSYNNFQPNQVQFGSADELMTRATDPVWIDAGLNPRAFRATRTPVSKQAMPSCLAPSMTARRARFPTWSPTRP